MIDRRILAALTALGLLAGCAAQPGTSTGPYPPVPPLMAETLPKPPVTGDALVWQPGHWDWSGSGYLWQPGQYVPAAGHGGLWQPGWWAPMASGWSWQPAHWAS